jgi:MobA-like NTP transferase domain
MVGATDAPPLLVLAGGLAKRYGGCKPLAPVGVHGEAVIDLTVSDALSAGFGEVVMVLGPQSYSAIRYHVRECWPSSVSVSFALQPLPLGTAHALLCGRELLPDEPFGVVNADDIYGVPALRRLVEHLRNRSVDGVAQHALVSFALRNTVVSDKPVTRGTCMVGNGRRLDGIVERRKVTMHDDGHFTSSDGLEPSDLDPDTPVSVNLWGFSTSIWPVLDKAVTTAQPGVDPDGSVRDERAVDEAAEVLLPEVVNAMVTGRGPVHDERAEGVVVVEGPGRCLGVTHAEDMPVVRNDLAAMTGQGLRPEELWEAAP